MNWVLGVGDFGKGIGYWVLWIVDWSQSPIPNPQSPFHIYLEYTPANDFEITKLNIENGLQDYDQVNFT